MSATSHETFMDRTAIVPEVVAQTVLESKEHNLSEEDAKWFCSFSSWWIRWFFANKPNWKKNLESENGRDESYMWIDHWAGAFIHDPKTFRVIHHFDEKDRRVV